MYILHSWLWVGKYQVYTYQALLCTTSITVLYIYSRNTFSFVKYFSIPERCGAVLSSHRSNMSGCFFPLLSGWDADRVVSRNEGFTGRGARSEPADRAPGEATGPHWRRRRMRRRKHPLHSDSILNTAIDRSLTRVKQLCEWENVE